MNQSFVCLLVFNCIFFNQATPLGAPRTSGRQRKIIDYNRLDKGLDSDEEPSTEKREVLATSKISSSVASRNVNVSIYLLSRHKMMTTIMKIKAFAKNIAP